MRRIPPFICMVFGFVLVALAGGNAVPPSVPGSGVVADVLPQPGLPVKLTVSAQSYATTEETWLVYAVANQAEEPVKNLGVFVAVYDADGRARGARMTQENLNLPPGEQHRAEVRFKDSFFVHPTQDSARIVVAVFAISTAGFSWEAERSDLVEALKTGQPMPVKR